jgi:hypothetical protein
MSDPVTELKHELLAAAEWQHAPASVRTGRRKRLVLAAATLAIAASGALFFTAPWDSSPGLLARAQAALTPPAGTILHQKFETTWISTDPACTVTRGPNEIWIDQTPPYRYRLLDNDFPLPPDGSIPDPRAFACSRGTASEFGGTLDPRETLRLVPPDTLIAWSGQFASTTDPVQGLRDALRAGKAHNEGKTELNGRTVERIRLEPPTDCPSFKPNCLQAPGYAYVDPETLYPVEIHGHGLLGLPGGVVLEWSRVVMRIVTYEYLPRTDANLALTDIQAQHPNATVAG